MRKKELPCDSPLFILFRDGVFRWQAITPLL
jgi:hypothetical protein